MLKIEIWKDNKLQMHYASKTPPLESIHHAMADRLGHVVSSVTQEFDVIKVVITDKPGTMKLWKISRIGPYDWDEYSDFVVRAPDEMAARQLCDSHDPASDHKSSHYQRVPSLWLKPEESTCVAVTHDGPSEIVCFSFHAG